MDPLTMGLAVGGVNLLGDLFAQGKQKDDYQRQWARPLRKRWNEFGPGIMAGLTAQREAVEAVPRITAGLRSRAASEMQQRMMRLNTSLAMQGRTSGSDIYERQQRMALESTNQQRTGIESEMGRLKSSLAQGLVSSNMAAGQFRRPTGGPEQTYVNPMNSIMSGLSAGLLANYYGNRNGGGMPSVGADGMTDYIRRPVYNNSPVDFTAMLLGQ